MERCQKIVYVFDAKLFLKVLLNAGDLPVFEHMTAFGVFGCQVEFQVLVFSVELFGWESLSCHDTQLRNNLTSFLTFRFQFGSVCLTTGLRFTLLCLQFSIFSFLVYIFNFSSKQINKPKVFSLFIYLFLHFSIFLFLILNNWYKSRLQVVYRRFQHLCIFYNYSILYKFVCKQNSLLIKCC